MRKFTPFLFLLAIVCFAFSSPDATENKVVQSAEKNLSAFLAKIPAGQESNFGFSNRAEFGLGKIGKPYHTITFTPAFYSDEKLDSKNYLQMVNEWRVPVTVNGENRVLLTVNQKDSAFAVNDIGGVGLAKELQQKTAANTSGNYYILRVYPLGFDILVQTNAGQSLADGIYTPTNAARAAVKVMNEKITFTQAEILKMVKEKSKEQSKH